MSDRWSKREGAVAAAVAISILVSVILALALGNAFWLAVPVAFAIGWRSLPGFWRTVLRGLAAGAVAGLLVLGPGFRLAMRVVAILDPIRTPEFTAEGTLFIVVFVGGLLGGIFGLAAALLRRGLGLSGPAMAGWMTVALIGFLLLGPDLRSEFTDLGPGAWFNIPMFGLVVYLYGLVTNRLLDRFTVARPELTSSAPVEVQA
jgi:hypothetical protein